MAYKVLSTKKLEPSLTALAKENNIEIIEKEFISITPILSQENYETIIKWAAKDKANVVITSVNAANILCDLLKFDDFYNVSEWNIFCMSGKTKDVLINYFPYLNIVATAESATSLAEKIIATKIKEVIFFCGDKRRDELPETLINKGIKVNEVILYETNETFAKIENDFDGIIFFSPSAVKSFFSNNQLNNLVTCFAIGDTTANSIKKYTGNKIIISKSPTQEMMLRSINFYFKNINSYK